jgi:hypothetical protein
MLELFLSFATVPGSPGGEEEEGGPGDSEHYRCGNCLIHVSDLPRFNVSLFIGLHSLFSKIYTVIYYLILLLRYNINPLQRYIQ